MLRAIIYNYRVLMYHEFHSHLFRKSTVLISNSAKPLGWAELCTPPQVHLYISVPENVTVFGDRGSL